MSDVLPMPAGEIGHPIPLLILVKGDDTLVHSMAPVNKSAATTPVGIGSHPPRSYPAARPCLHAEVRHPPGEPRRA